MMPVTISSASKAFSRWRPGLGALGLFARQAGFAEAVFDGIQPDFDFIADLDFQLAVVVVELFDGDGAFGLQAGVDDDLGRGDLDDGSGDDGTGAHLFGDQTLFKEFGETFTHGLKSWILVEDRRCMPRQDAETG